MILYLGDRRLVLRVPTVVLIPGETVHIAQAARGRPARADDGRHLAIQRDCLKASGCANGFVAGPLRPEHAAMMWATLEFLNARLCPPACLPRDDIRTLVGGLLCLLKQLGYGARGAVAASSDPVQRAVDLVMERYADPALTVAAMAGQARLSPSHLRRLFHRAIGCSPRRFLSRVRLDRFTQLRHTPQLKMAGLAQMVGFTSTSALYKLRHRQAKRHAALASRQTRLTQRSSVLERKLDHAH